MCINDLKPGQSAIIDFIRGDAKLVKRLHALGYIEGTQVIVKNSAPLGDPVIISSRGSNLALRRKDAEGIKLKEA